VWLDGLPVATDIPPVEVIAGRDCAVLFFTEDNPDDAVVVTVHGSAPGYVRMPSYGNVIGNMAPSPTTMLLLRPEAGGESVPSGRTAIDVQPQWNPSAGAQNWLGISGNALVVNTGLTQTQVYGLDFQAIISGGTVTDAAGARVRIGVTTNTTITTLRGIVARRPSQVAGAITSTTAVGVDVEDIFPGGAAVITTAYAIRAAAPTGGTNRYGLQVGDITGGTVARILELGPSTPHLRLEGSGNWNPGANTAQTALLLLAGNNDNPLTKTLRRLQWKDGAAIGAGDRVCVLV
jgi:hypothetical protein